MLKRILLSAMFSFGVLYCFAQKGVVSGHVADKITGEDAIGANVVIQGTTVGAPTDIIGNFSFPVEAGTYTLIVTSIGYQRLVVEGVQVNSGEEVSLSFLLDTDNKQLEEVVVKGIADKTSESVLLLDRKNAVGFIQSIGSQELSRKGIANAESAVVQITGVSKQEGVKNVFVRGLGDRYNSTSLNGLPLPSEDPEFKNISLDFFTSDLIQSIDVNKTFDAETFGDVAGANINIGSKNLFEEKEFKISASVGSNSQTRNSDFYKADGTNFLGTASNDIPVNDLKVYGFENSFQPNMVSGPLVNSNLSVSGGKSFTVGSNVLKVFAVGAMNSNYFFKEGVARQINPVGQPSQDLTYKRSEYSTYQLAMANASYEYSRNNYIRYTGLYIHNNNQWVGDYTGFNVNGIDDDTEPNAYDNFIRRQQQNNNRLFVNQFLTQFQISDKVTVNIDAALNNAAGDEPDRRSSFYIFDGDQYRVNSGAPSYSHRYFSQLTETEIVGKISGTYKWKEEGNGKISFGYNVRSTHRDFEATQFVFDFGQPSPIDVNNPDAIFNQESLDNGVFKLQTTRGSNSTAFIPFTYTGDRFINAGFVNTVFDITPSFLLNAGLRAEVFSQEVDWSTNLSAGDEKRDKVYFLPSINAKYSVNKDNILRLSASQTYTFPQFKELAPFYYEDINESSFGNPYLKPAEIINIDLRYEYYFSPSEFVALTGFYKYITLPIIKAQVASAANDLSYVNTDWATAQGVELEIKKEFFRNGGLGAGSSVSTGLNVSYLYSNELLNDIPNDNLSFFATDKESALQGASPLLVNFDVTFRNQNLSNNLFSATFLLITSDNRIYAVGAQPADPGSIRNQSIYQTPIQTLDFISSYEFSKGLMLSLKVKNILNPSYRLTKDVLKSGQVVEQTIQNFNKGVSTSIGISYRF